MSLLKFVGAAFSLFVVGLLALMAFLVFTPVSIDNVSLRISLACQSYRLLALSAPADGNELAWARNIDCGCVRERITTKSSIPQYAQYLENVRRGMLESVPRILDGGAPTGDPFNDAAGQYVAATLPVTLAKCQKRPD